MLEALWGLVWAGIGLSPGHFLCNSHLLWGGLDLQSDRVLVGRCRREVTDRQIHRQTPH